MEVTKLIAIFYIFLAIISTSIFSIASSQEVEDESEFNYIVGDDHGPGRWGLIHEEWEACDKGLFQSPIDLSDKKAEKHYEFTRPRRTYRSSTAILSNRGHDMMLKWEDGAGGFWVNGTEYTLQQLHWHTPSEHTLNGERFALELHMVHQSADNKTAVVGILYRFGRPDSFLAEMEKYIRDVHGQEPGEESVGKVNPRHIILGTREYYRYIGSLTTPPCNEGVVWTIINKVRTVSKQQVELVREAVLDGMGQNARPIKDTNDRVISFYQPKLNKH